MFNGTVNVAILSPDEALSGFYGKEILEEQSERPTSWEQFTSFLIKTVLYVSLLIVGTVITIFALLFLGAAFGW